MTEFFIIDTRTNEIVNCVSTSESLEEATASTQRAMIEGEFLRLDANPPMAMLKRYEFWDKRP